jgi:L-serine/L-threonine ammonia-lyase
MQLHEVTPIVYADRLSQKLQKEIWFKMDCYQPSHSFKIRGVGRLCVEAVKKGSRQLVCASGGNAGLATAYAGNRLRVTTLIVVPITTSDFAIQKIKALGAQVKIFGEDWDEANTYAKSWCKKESATYIPPFDHPSIWAGNASVIDECKWQLEKQPDLIITAVGGGGYFCGVIEGIERNYWGATKIATAETYGTASLHDSIKARKLITLEEIASKATTLGAKRVAKRALEDALQHDVTPFLVSDDQALDACRQFADDTNSLVELACGAALSAVYHNLGVIAEAESVLVLVCGGSSMTYKTLYEGYL